MRKNFPITQNEYYIKDNIFIVSKSDLNGRITYANSSFIEVSGFNEGELIGSSYNIIRHPDMPSDIFYDMWRTIKCGMSWNAMVKNRCKNGDYYWVNVNVVSLVENGEIIGYFSIHEKPSRSQVEQAENLYRAMQEGNASLVIYRSQLIKKGAWGWGKRIIWSLKRFDSLFQSIVIFLLIMIVSAFLTMFFGTTSITVIAGVGILCALFLF